MDANANPNLLSNDIVKMNLIDHGYLPNHPYHMISNEEMCDAFISGTIDGNRNTLKGFFSDMYPCPSLELYPQYTALVNAILYHISEFNKSNDIVYKLPDWVYTYMFGSVIGPNSDELIIHDLLVLLGRDNINDIYTPYAATECLSVSKAWVSKLSSSARYVRIDGNLLDVRPPTMFGEPHVIKALRVRNAQQFK